MKDNMKCQMDFNLLRQHLSIICVSYLLHHVEESFVVFEQTLGPSFRGHLPQYL